jgi:hypothetical protein
MGGWQRAVVSEVLIRPPAGGAPPDLGRIDASRIAVD